MDDFKKMCYFGILILRKYSNTSPICLAQALSAALLLLTPGFDAAQLRLTEPPLQLVYPEGAILPPGKPAFHILLGF